MPIRLIGENANFYADCRKSERNVFCRIRPFDDGMIGEEGRISVKRGRDNLQKDFTPF